jgi:hypothetical protein
LGQNLNGDIGYGMGIGNISFWHFALDWILNHLSSF